MPFNRRSLPIAGAYECIEPQDSIQAFGSRQRLQPALTTVLAWDYKAKRCVAASVPALGPIGGPEAPQLE